MKIFALCSNGEMEERKKDKEGRREWMGEEEEGRILRKSGREEMGKKGREDKEGGREGRKREI